MTLWKTVSTICIRATSSVGGSTIPSRDKSLLRMVEPFIYKGWLQTVKLRPLVKIKLARPIRSQYFRFSINKPQDQSFFFLVQKHHV